MYEYILFDFDGTVFDTVEGITKSIRFAINKQGMDRKLSALRCFAGPPLVEKFMEEYGFSKEQAETATADFRERYLPFGLYECSVFPGVKDLLAALRAAGKRLAVATSKPQNLAETLLEREGMLECFDLICGSLPNSNAAKWQVVKRAMDGLGAEGEKTLLVGDTKYDVEGAHLCNIACAAVRYGYAAEGELEEAGADYIVKDTAGLESLILG